MGDAMYSRHMVDAGLGSISAVVSSLPAGYTLGERRVVGNVEYKLAFNAGNSEVTPGLIATPAAGSVGAHSLTVSSASQLFHQFGAGLVVHSTLTTGTYGWVAVKGTGLGVVGDNTSVPTGSAFYLSANGKVTLMPQSIITGNLVIGLNNGGASSKTVTTGAKSGDCIVNLLG